MYVVNVLNIIDFLFRQGLIGLFPELFFLLRRQIQPIFIKLLECSHHTSPIFHIAFFLLVMGETFEWRALFDDAGFGASSSALLWASCAIAIGCRRALLGLLSFDVGCGNREEVAYIGEAWLVAWFW